MINCTQMRAARAMLGIDQKELAHISVVSVPTIQRMEQSKGPVRGNIDTLVKIVKALDAHGIELIGENAHSVSKGRGVRFKDAQTTKNG